MLMLVATGVVLLGCFSTRTEADESIKIMPLGDSITRGYFGSVYYWGYRKPLYDSLTGGSYNFDFVGSMTDPYTFPDPQHEGHDGWKADGILYGVRSWLDAHQPDVVLLHIGTNDITWEDEDANEVNDILNVIDDYENANNKHVTVILALIINRQPNSPATTQFNTDVNDMAQNRIAAGDDIIIVDMESALDYGTDMYDNLHPNDAGYAKMADVWYDALDNLLAEAPVITSTPLTKAVTGYPYTYDVDANGCPAPHYTLTTYHEGMIIDPNTGLIEWTPAAVGDFDVTVEASNGYPPDVNQSFTITVSSTIIEFDAASSTSSSSSGTTLSWSHIIGNSDNRVLVVGVAAEDNSENDLQISSVNYNDVNLDMVEGTSQLVYFLGKYIKTELYYLLDSNLPSSGTYVVEVTYSGAVHIRTAGAISLANVEQQPREAAGTNSDTNSNSISTDIITQTDRALVVDVVGCGNLGTFTATTEEMIAQWQESPNGASGAGSTTPVVSAGPTTISWSHSDSGANGLAHSAAAFAAIRHIISGYVLEPNNTPIEGVLVSADNDGGCDTTEPNGYYEALVLQGWSGAVTPTKAGCMFAPGERIYNSVLTNQLSQDYKDISIYDLDGDGYIDWYDVAIIAENWAKTDPDIEGGDINGNGAGDGIVDFRDFAELALVG